MRGNQWLVLILCMLLFLSCKHLKRTKVQEIKPVEETSQELFVQIYEAPVLAPDSVDLDFRLVQVIPYKDSIFVKMRYGGGCIKPHIFEMYTSAMPNKDGVIDIYLAHKTHDDKCKAFVFTERIFLWSHLFSPGHTIRINGGDIFQITDN